MTFIDTLNETYPPTQPTPPAPQQGSQGEATQEVVDDLDFLNDFVNTKPVNHLDPVDHLDPHPNPDPQPLNVEGFVSGSELDQMVSPPAPTATPSGASQEEISSPISQGSIPASFSTNTTQPNNPTTPVNQEVEGGEPSGQLKHSPPTEPYKPSKVWTHGRDTSKVVTFRLSFVLLWAICEEMKRRGKVPRNISFNKLAQFACERVGDQFLDPTQQIPTPSAAQKQVEEFLAQHNTTSGERAVHQHLKDLAMPGKHLNHEDPPPEAMPKNPFSL